MRPNIPFYRHALGAADAARVAAVLETPMLTSGDVGKEVETRLRAFFGARHAGLTNSWTNGAVAALLALDIGPGDEVVVPAMTFIATANAAELVGATPVFADVDPDTLLISTEAVLAATGPRTRAVLPVHLYGQMVDMRALRASLDAAGRADIRLIEDAAHCFEGSLGGQLPGMHSDIALFSFYATKNVTCGEGGAYVTNSDLLAERMAQTRLHGMSAGAAERFRAGAYRHWDMARLGTKANLPDLLAALLPPQIETIRERLPRRAAVARRYDQALAGLPIRRPALHAQAVSAHHIYPIHVPPSVRDTAIAALNAEGVAVAVNYRAVPTRAYYRRKYGFGPASFPVSEAWGEGTITLPFFPDMTPEDQEHVVAVLRERIAPMCRRAA
jgi:dTDP-4-amino-4,6-dideoxygalactose transaminase